MHSIKRIEQRSSELQMLNVNEISQAEAIIILFYKVQATLHNKRESNIKAGVLRVNNNES